MQTRCAKTTHKAHQVINNRGDTVPPEMKGLKTMTSFYKYDEIKEHFDDFILDVDSMFIFDNYEDLHHECFNTDYYIIGTYQAEQWLGNKAFEVINIIKEYEQDNFGEVFTDLSNPEKVVNMYAYIVGEQVVNEWMQDNEKLAMKA